MAERELGGKNREEEERRRDGEAEGVVSGDLIFFFFSSYLFMSAEISIPVEIGRNDRNSPKWAKIFFEVEQESFSFRFAHWYEIFRPERNRIYNFAFCTAHGHPVQLKMNMHRS